MSPCIFLFTVHVLVHRSHHCP